MIFKNQHINFLHWIIVINFQLDMGPTPFQRHFEHIIAEAPVHDEGEPNEYYSSTFMPSLVKYFLPHAPLWSALMLGECTITNVSISAISSCLFVINTAYIWDI